MEGKSNLLMRTKEQDSGEAGFQFQHISYRTLNKWPPFFLSLFPERCHRRAVTRPLGKTLRSGNDGQYMKSKILLFQQLQMSPTPDASHTQTHTHTVSFHKQDILSLFHHRSRVVIRPTNDIDTFVWVKTCWSLASSPGHSEQVSEFSFSQWAASFVNVSCTIYNQKYFSWVTNSKWSYKFQV